MEHSNRRTFLKAGVALTAASAWAAPREMHKAIMYATVTLDGPVLAKFHAVRAAGFEGIEPMSHMDPSEVLAAFAATGLKAASVCCATHWKKPLSDPDPAIRKQGLEGLQVALRDAKAYGASSVLLVPAVVNKQVSYVDAYQRSQAEGIFWNVPLTRCTWWTSSCNRTDRANSSFARSKASSM